MKKNVSMFFIIVLLCLCSLKESHAALEVFVSIPPQKWLCDKLGGELLKTHVLVAKGEDPHTFEPRPRQVANLFKSKVYFTLDLEFEQRIIEKLKQTASGLNIRDTAKGIDRIGGHHEQDKDHATEMHDHEHHEGDPHIWLSPLNLQKIAATMTETLVSQDRENAAVYTKNLQILHDELEQLHADITKRLSPYKGASFYVFHPAFGHFAKCYGLIQVPVEIEGKSPRPKQLSALIARARKEKVKVIFVQPQFDTKSAKAVAAAIEGRVVPLNALAEDVAANLENMSESIETALQKR